MKFFTQPVAAYYFRALCFAAFLLQACPAPSQVVAYHAQLVEGEWRGDKFDSLGIDATGVWIRGDHYGDSPYLEAFIRYTGSGFEALPLGFDGVPPQEAEFYDAEPRSMSRDGQYIVGIIDGEKDWAVLWTRSRPQAPIFLGTFPPDETPEVWDVASTRKGPLVVGYYSFGTFLWTPGDGFQAWMTNSDFWPLRHTYHVSADGKKWAGAQYSLFTTTSNTTILGVVPFVGTKNKLEILDANGSSNGQVLAMSPNGEHMVGVVDFKPTIWSKKKVRIFSNLTVTNSFVFVAVTDNGFAGGVGPTGGVLYESEGDKVERFDDWWARNYPSVRLPAHVAAVRDLQEYEQNLYCLIDLDEAEIGFRISALAIAPIKPKKNARQAPR